MGCRYRDDDMELCSSWRMQTLNPIGSGRASRGVIGNLAGTCLEPITVGAPLARGRARTLEARRPKQSTQWKELAMQADAAFRCSQPDEARMVYCDRLLMASESRLPGALRKAGSCLQGFWSLMAETCPAFRRTGALTPRSSATRQFGAGASLPRSGG